MNMTGTISKTEGSPNPHTFHIKGDDGKGYFAHLGDLQTSEEILYKTSINNTLKEKDRVSFEIPRQPNPNPCVIHVRKDT